MSVHGSVSTEREHSESIEINRADSYKRESALLFCVIWFDLERRRAMVQK